MDAETEEGVTAADASVASSGNSSRGLFLQLSNILKQGYVHNSGLESSYFFKINLYIFLLFTEELGEKFGRYIIIPLVSIHANDLNNITYFKLDIKLSIYSNISRIQTNYTYNFCSVVCTKLRLLYRI